jgi:hypothetical protein
MSDLISTGRLKPGENKSFKHGIYHRNNGDVEYYRSSYELIRMQELDNDVDVISWTTKHGIKIPYDDNGIAGMYIPDFLISYIDGKTILEEVKGWISDVEKHEKKVYAAKNWCKHLHYTYKLNYMK